MDCYLILKVNPASSIEIEILVKWGLEDGLPEKNEGNDGTCSCTARPVLAVQTETLGEAHNYDLGYGEECERSHSIRR